MKKIITFITILCLLFSIAACSVSTKEASDTTIDSPERQEDQQTSNEQILLEPTEVPESVVLTNVSVPENFTHQIIHNYDASSHMDSVQLIMQYNGNFGTHTKTYSYTYQYDKSSDLWSLIGGNNGLQSDIITFSEDAYMKNNYFTGEFSGYHQGSYNITINKIDFTAKKVTAHYVLVFNDDSSVLSATSAFEIQDTTTDELCFSIPYKRSMVVRFEQLFIFDIDEGLHA